MREEYMSCYTTLGVGGKAWVKAACSVADLSDTPDGSVILGGGSNALIGEKNLPMFIINRVKGAVFNGEEAYFMSGESLSAVRTMAAERGLSGLEWAVGIPGTVGGALAGNAGTRSGDIASSVDYVDVIEGKSFVRMPAGACGFAYRQSALSGRIIVGAGMTFTRRTRQEIEQNQQAAAKLRSRQPEGRSAGCIFKNPPGISIGKIMDRLGLKGKRHGAAMISPKHANFIVNEGGATAGDVYYLICYAEEKLYKELGFMPRREVKIYGEF